MPDSDLQPTAAASPEVQQGITRALARHLVAARPEDLPGAVRAEGIRTFLNWMGCAVGGARHNAVQIALDTLSPFSKPQATILGRKERLDVLHAALVNGISSHVFDFDDTHLKTVIHPAGPVASALLALSEHRPVTGAEFLNALVLGVDVECRIGNAVYPDHYDVGWHITGTTGVFGAAAAVGKLLGLDEQRMAWALSLAATQPVGLREMFGTMTKSFHPGRAAQNGLTAALMAAGGYTSSEQGIEAKRGWAKVTSTHRDYAEITGELGSRYEILLNAYKPFACGIVIHPTIDGCIQLRNEHRLTAADIASVALSVHPLVLELTGKTTPRTGLDGKFSIYHSAATAIIHGRAGEGQYSDAAVQDPDTVRLRAKVSATIDPAMPADAVHITLTTMDGRTLTKHVDHAIGSLKRPMSDAELDAKFLDLVDAVLPVQQGRGLLAACRDLERAPDAGAIARAAIAM